MGNAGLASRFSWLGQSEGHFSSSEFSFRVSCPPVGPGWKVWGFCIWSYTLPIQHIKVVNVILPPSFFLFLRSVPLFHLPSLSLWLLSRVAAPLMITGLFSPQRAEVWLGMRRDRDVLWCCSQKSGQCFHLTLPYHCHLDSSRPCPGNPLQWNDCQGVEIIFRLSLTNWGSHEHLSHSVMAMESQWRLYLMLDVGAEVSAAVRCQKNPLEWQGGKAVWQDCNESMKRCDVMILKFLMHQNAKHMLKFQIKNT